MLISYLLTPLICLVIFTIMYRRQHSNKDFIKRAYAANCTALAQCTTAKVNDETDTWECRYTYEYQGQLREYYAIFIHEEQPKQLRLFWDAKHPEKVYTEQEAKALEYTKIKPPVVALITVIFASILFAISCSPISAILTIVIGMLLKGRRTPINVLISAILCLCWMVSTLSYIGANYDPWAYDAVEYDLTMTYPVVKTKLQVIDELSSDEIISLYYDWSWLNREIVGGIAKRKAPFFGCYVNRYWVTLEPLEWPEEYSRWLDWDYREQMAGEGSII